MNTSLHTFGEILGIGTPELLVVLAIVLLLFGGKKIPELARSAGQSIREFKGTVGDVKSLKEPLVETRKALRPTASAARKEGTL